MATAEDGSVVRYWGNQHGHGIVIEGPLAEQVQQACDLRGWTPEEFLKRALDNYFINHVPSELWPPGWQPGQKWPEVDSPTSPDLSRARKTRS